MVVKSDGSIWFTDPPFGLGGYYEGSPAKQELGQNIYRFDPESGRGEIVADDVLGPNGLCFSPDETKLYVVESRAAPTRKLKVFDVAKNGMALNNGRMFIDCGPGAAAGMRCDTDGNLWCGWGMGKPELDGVMVFAPDATPIGRIALPERCANLCFGGKHRNRLFMAASQSLYAVYVHAQGVPGS